MDLHAIILACAPFAAPATIAEIIRVESAGNPLAINVNNGGRLARLPSSAADAVQIVADVISTGASADLGLMQLNTRTLEGMGVPLSPSVFDPCINIHLGAVILHDAYVVAMRSHGPGQEALIEALSRYNTGDPKRGFRNGYVARFSRQGNRSPPAPTWNHAAIEAIAAPTTVFSQPPHQEPVMIDTAYPRFSENLRDITIPGVQVLLDPDQADALGVIEDDALSEEDAWESNSDAAGTDREGRSP